MTQDIDNRLEIEFCYYLTNANIFHKIYLAEGKKFKFAELIYSQNSKALELIPEILTKNTIDIFHSLCNISTHFELWKIQFDELEKSINPGKDTEFVFETLVNFPKKDADIILEKFI